MLINFLSKNLYQFYLFLVHHTKDTTHQHIQNAIVLYTKHIIEMFLFQHKNLSKENLGKIKLLNRPIMRFTTLAIKTFSIPVLILVNSNILFFPFIELIILAYQAINYAIIEYPIYNMCISNIIFNKCR